MSVDIAFWFGPRPDSGEAAQTEFRRRYNAREGRAPAQQLRAFVAALLDRYPEHDDGDDEKVWGDGPVMECITGSLLYLSLMSTAECDEAIGFMVEEADRRGIVAYDPSGGSVLRPVGTH